MCGDMDKTLDLNGASVLHHVELCVKDRHETVSNLKKFGFKVFAKRETGKSKQIVTKLGTSIYFIINERGKSYEDEDEDIFPNLVCCEQRESHCVDTVFNVALNVKNVFDLSKRVLCNGGSLIVPPRIIKDEYGQISLAVVKSVCGNILHTLLNKSLYHGPFLPGFELQEEPDTVLHEIITHIDHVTLACNRRDSSKVFSFYQSCFGMQKVDMREKEDNENEGLISADDVGIRLRAMEYFRCAETGLIYPSTSYNRPRNPNSVMFVLVESLPGQTNCQVETFLREHQGPGIEHIALSTTNMLRAVSLMNVMGSHFRNPPQAYYTQLKKKTQEIEEDLITLEKLGILLDNELCSEKDTRKYLMQIFAFPLFSRQTFFFEVLQRKGARGLGVGNIIALVRSIREEDMCSRTISE